ncbi:unnamed protein product [Cuscuta campestris]|uniref:Leucine-rich repeat-containing N-terminal plant-type domain-containing protein n=1 Tax=Cuscuta campestris TaxID=132261 RepID=A0A484KY64_9ASTE|nr:unnamed protein product [Cuscuta campestris]
MFRRCGEMDANCKMISVSNNLLQGQLPRDAYQAECPYFAFQQIRDPDYFYGGTVAIYNDGDQHRGAGGKFKKPPPSPCAGELTRQSPPRIIPVAAATERRCHDEEKAALLQFKHSFASTNQCYDGYLPSYVHPKPKLESWKDGGDCCSWEGVECDDRTDHVIGLDLSGSCLFGSINSSSNALFTLTHLQRLDLSNNDFNYSQIPSAVGNLSRLTHLNLKHSYLTGRIPQQQLSNITTLVSLDLSFNYVRGDVSAHGLEVHSLEGLVQRMINLKELHLSDVRISSSRVPQLLSNFSSLESLLLLNCELRGEFPVAIFHLPKLQMLDLSDNHDLRGYLPDFPSGSPLKSLQLFYTSFGGVVPPSIGNLASLEDIDISYCNFTGNLPMSLGNLTQLVSFNFWGTNHYKHERWFDPDSNHFSPDSLTTTSLSWIRKLTKLTSLNLAHLDLTETVTQLSVLILGSNRLHGVISDGFGFPNLRVINLSNNRFSGKMPSKFIETSNPMRALNASHMMGYMEQDLLPISYWIDEDFGQFDYAMTINNKGLERSYMKIPDTLCGIDFSSNNFEGQIPDAFGDLAGLQMLNLSRNNLSGHIPSSFSNMKNVESLDLSRNQLSGHIPMDPTKLTYLSAFDVSYNNLSGPIPQGNQFCTFEIKSFEGNVGLFFEPWNKLCGNARSSLQVQQPPSPTEEEEEDDSESDLKIEWMIILIGFASGLVVGVILGNELIARKQYWFVKTLARMGIWQA